MKIKFQPGPTNESMNNIHASKSVSARLREATAAVMATPGPADKAVTEFFDPDEYAWVEQALKGIIDLTDGTHARGRIRAVVMGETDLWDKLWEAVSEVEGGRDADEVVNKLIPNEKCDAAWSLMYSMRCYEAPISVRVARRTIHDIVYHR